MFKKKFLNEDLTRIFDFQLAALALKLSLLFRKILLSEKYQGDYVGNFFEKYVWINWMNWTTFEILLMILARNLRTHLSTYFPNVFFMTKKLAFSTCLLLNLCIAKRIFHAPMFHLYRWQKSLTNICKRFHLCKVQRKINQKKLRDFRPGFLKECCPCKSQRLLQFILGMSSTSVFLLFFTLLHGKQARK